MPQSEEPGILQQRYEDSAPPQQGSPPAYPRLSEAPPPPGYGDPQRGGYSDDYDDDRRRRRMNLRGSALATVSGPAIGLIVTGILGIVINAGYFLLQMVQISEMNRGPRGRRGDFGGGGGDELMVGGIIMCGALIFSITVGVLIIVGASKMKRLESYAFAMVSSILAMIPCISPCCLLGLPFGIWALVVLNDQNVKDAFKS
ncbi:MAG: hypothetical protein K2R98_10510 [Gemmataceae bacterium]|nr:hypothetical protein [Gemmataceae bacterium]